MLIVFLRGVVLTTCSLIAFASWGSQDPPVTGSSQSGSDPDQNSQSIDQPPTGEDPPPTQPGSESEQPSFAELHQQWIELEGKFKQKEAEFDAATPDLKETIRADYQQLLVQANELLPKLRAATIAAYREKPNEDEVVIKLLIGMMLNDARFSNDVQAFEIGELLTEHACDMKYMEAAEKDRRLFMGSRNIVEEIMIRRREADTDDLPRVKITTDKGEIVLELFENEAPNTVANFISLIESGFYDGLTFHRVLEGAIAQGGCPEGNGQGGPGYNIACECFKEEMRRHFYGSLSMAHTGRRDTGGSQFFITMRRIPNYDGLHTVFGRMISGKSVLDQIQRRAPGGADQPAADKMIKVEVLRKRPHEYLPEKIMDPNKTDGENPGGDSASADKSGSS